MGTLLPFLALPLIVYIFGACFGFLSYTAICRFNNPKAFQFGEALRFALTWGH